MQIDEKLYFAPGVSFSEVDLGGAGLPDQLLARIEGYYLRPAHECVSQNFAFAAGLLSVACIDASALLAHGPNRGKRKVVEDFIGYSRTRLPSFRSEESATILYEKYRNGLVHEARLKDGAQFAFGLRTALDTTSGFPIIDAGLLLSEVRASVFQLIEEIRHSQEFLQQVTHYLERTFQVELQSARSEASVANGIQTL